MPKVLVVTNMFPAEERPADGIFVKETVDQLRKDGAEVDVLYIKGRRTVFKYIAYVPVLWWRLTRKRYDVVHAFYGYSGIVAVLQAGVPVVLTLCGSDVNLNSQRWISRIAARLASVVVVQTAGMRELLRCPRAVVLPFGVDLTSFFPTDSGQAKARLGLDGGLLYALFPYDPSRKGKRYALFEEAVAEARKLDARLRPLTLGRLPRELIPVYMSAADVMVLTSEAEGSPTTVKEALAVGLPIVSVDVGDVAEAVAGVEGCMICEAEPRSIAGAIVTAARHGRTRGRQKAELMSSVEVSKRIMNLYEEALRSSERRA